MDPKITGEVEITLDKPTSIKASHFTDYRLSQFRNHFTGENAGEFGYLQACTYVWAMLPHDRLNRFPHPENLTEFITLKNFHDYIPKIVEALNLGASTTEKKREKSANGPSLDTA